MRQGKRPFRGLALCAALLCVTAGSPWAATVSGQVKNEAGAGLANVDLDFIDACSGDNIFLSGDKTAADGTYAVIVPNGTYDIHFTPPAGGTVAAADLQTYAVTANVNLGVTTLHPGRLFSGVVQTPAFGPAAGVDLKFTNVATGNRVFLTKDLTDAAGQYAVRVPPGTYDIDYRPPVTTNYLDRERLGVVIGASDVTGLVDVLATGFTVTGVVRDKLSQNIKNLDIDVFDECTGARLATAHDNTDVNGNYSVCVPAGRYIFNYDPPACKSLASARAPGTTISANTALGTEKLAAAVRISGVVHNHLGQPLVDARIKFFDATSTPATRQAATRDHTDATGSFSIDVPVGIYDLDIEPAAGVPEQVGHLSAVVVNAPVNVGVIQLSAGVFVSGRLLGPGSVPAVNVNINAVDSATRVAQRLAHDATDQAGNFRVAVAPGTYDFQYDPPTCSGLAPSSQNAVDAHFPKGLFAFGLVTGVHASGTVHDALAQPVGSVDLDFYPIGSATRLYTPADKTNSSGSYNTLLPPGTYDIKYIPPSSSRCRPAERTAVSLATTQTLPLVTFANGWFVSGRVINGNTLAPIPGVTIDFYAPGAANAAWTPHHVTAADGTYKVAVDAGTWDIVYAPPFGGGVATLVRHAVVVTADTPLADAALFPPTSAGAFPAASPALRLSAPWPNPSHGMVQFALAAPNDAAELSIWDVAGRRVATIWRGATATPVTVQWDAKRKDGTPLPGGVYFARLVSRAGASHVERLEVVR